MHEVVLSKPILVDGKETTRLKFEVPTLKALRHIKVDQKNMEFGMLFDLYQPFFPELTEIEFDQISLDDLPKITKACEPFLQKLLG